MSDTFLLDRLTLAKPGLAATAAEIERRSRAPLMHHGAHPGQKTHKLPYLSGTGKRLERSLCQGADATARSFLRASR
jgi:hypothetical protein